MSSSKSLKRGTKVQYTPLALKRLKLPKGHTAFTATGTVDRPYSSILTSAFYYIKWSNHIYIETIANIADLQKVKK